MKSNKNTPETNKGAVANKATSDVAVVDIGNFLEDNAGDGTQNISSNDLQIPRLKLVQKVDEAAPEDAKAGDIYNNVTDEFWKSADGLEVIPCMYEKQYTQWKKREVGGGFLGTHPASSDILSKTKKDGPKDIIVDDSGNLTDELIRTDGNFYVLYKDKDSSWKPAVISMYSTNFKKAKLWNTMIKSQTLQGKNGLFNPPSYAFTYLLSSETREDSGNKWSVWKITIGKQVGEVEVLTEAKKLSQSIRSGEISAKPEEESFQETSDNEDSGMV